MLKQNYFIHFHLRSFAYIGLNLLFYFKEITISLTHGNTVESDTDREG